MVLMLPISIKELATNPAAAKMTLEQLFGDMAKYSAVIRNNGGGHYNHTMFWKSLSPKAATAQPANWQLPSPGISKIWQM